MTKMTETSWAQDLLKRMGYDVNENNMTTILAWEYAEGGHFHNSAHYNPLNTTRDHDKFGVMPGGNSSGVATYPNYKTGMDQTVATLKLGSYQSVRHDLARSAAPATTVAAIAASPWGTWKGVPTGPALARAKAEVKKHPGIADGGKKTGGAGSGSKAKNKVVLDLHELDRLSKVYRNATDEILRHRKVVGDIAAAVEPARAALPDKGLATVIQATFNWLLEPGGGFENDARLHDQLSAYTADVHRLASEADADHNGKWSKTEAKRFAADHKGEDTPALAAVMQALAHGTIVRKSPAQGGGTKGGGTKGGGNGDAGGGRAAKIDKMLDFASKQHANDGGSNHTKYGAWYRTNGVAWCAQFVSYVFAHSGNQLPSIDGTKGKGFQYVPDGINYARAHGQLHNTPHKGDIFLRKDGQHTGIVSKVNSDGTFQTIEGNAGPQTDRVVHGQRNAKDGIYYFWTAIK